MPNLLRPDVLARAENLGLMARSIVEGLRVGDHKSPFRGFSVEFVQHREYVPGDDTRHIDWKSYGRSERYTIKQYEQETNFIAHVVMDGSLSMQYGEGEQNKLQYAKLLTASLAYLTIMQRDSFGLNIFDSEFRTQLPPSSQLTHINTITHTLEATVPQEKTALGPLLVRFADQIRRRGIVFLISDCFDDVPSLLKGLQALRFQGHDVTVFHVMHHHEIDFPFDGNMRFLGMEMPEELKTRPHLIRNSYLKVLGAYLEEFRRGCEGCRCDYVKVDTSVPMVKTLSDYLVRRLQMGRM